MLLNAMPEKLQLWDLAIVLVLPFYTTLHTLLTLHIYYLAIGTVYLVKYTYSATSIITNLNLQLSSLCCSVVCSMADRW